MRLFMIAAVVAVVLTTALGTAAARPDLSDVMWIVKCVGDSLGGNACHGP